MQFHYTICLHQTQETLYLCDFFVKHVKNPASAPSLPGFGMVTAIPHNSKCRYSERGAAAAKPKAQITLDAAKVSAASGGNSEPKQPDIIEHFGNADAVPQPPGRCLSRQAGIVRCCLTKISPCSPRTALTKPPAWRIVKDRICKLYAHCPALCNNAVRVPPAAPA
uniref:hypothetical protein n=1 Tax=Gemmiger qucibialis TaxID=2997294 RepID=UPI0040280818